MSLAGGSAVTAAAGGGSAAAETGTGSAGGVPKWVYGLAIGVPVTAALLYILFGPDDADKKEAKRKKKKDPSSTTSTTTATPTKPSEPAPSKPAEADKPASPATAPTLKKESPAQSPAKNNENPDLPQMPTDPLEKAVALKNRGNKFFRGGRYELAIKSYSEAIDVCPKDKPIDLATFYQNRAAAYDQLENTDSVLSDCDTALNLNNKYVKALDRRAKALRKQAKKIENFSVQIEKLKQCVEDITSVCLLEGFQKQEHLMLVDQVLRELGRAEAALASKSRTPLLPSNNFISQYLESFAEDPINKILKKESEGDIDEKENGVDLSSGFSRAKQCLIEEEFASIIDDCTQEIETDPDTSTAHLARLLRGTFYALRKQQDCAMDDLTILINAGDTVDSKVRVNALVKRASLYIQMCKDPKNDPELSLADFARAAEIDPDNSDIYNHRGQVFLLLEEMNKSIVDFNRAVRLNPNHPIAYAQKLYTDYRCAVMIGDATKVNTVISDFYEAIEKNPKCVENYSLAAQVLNAQEAFKEADALYKKALEVDPKNANLLVHRGLMALQSRGDIEEGVRLIEKALEMDELCEFAYETLGTIEVQKGNLKRAIELYEKAIPLANTELEMAHLFGLRAAATSQITVSQRFGIDLNQRMSGMPGVM